MSYQLQIGGEEVNHKLGVDLNKVYSRACAALNPLTRMASDYIPDFESLYEEYCDMYLTKVTEASVVLEEIKQLSTSKGGEDLGNTSVGKADFLNILFMRNYTFFLNGQLMNPIILEVW
jgi:hypothetical protein